MCDWTEKFYEQFFITILLIKVRQFLNPHHLKLKYIKIHYKDILRHIFGTVFSDEIHYRKCCFQ